MSSRTPCPSGLIRRAATKSDPRTRWVEETDGRWLATGQDRNNCLQGHNGVAGSAHHTTGNDRQFTDYDLYFPKRSSCTGV